MEYSRRLGPKIWNQTLAQRRATSTTVGRPSDPIYRATLWRRTLAFDCEARFLFEYDRKTCRILSPVFAWLGPACFPLSFYARRRSAKKLRSRTQFLARKVAAENTVSGIEEGVKEHRYFARRKTYKSLTESIKKDDQRRWTWVLEFDFFGVIQWSIVILHACDQPIFRTATWKELVKFSYKVLVVLHWVKPETNITTSSLKCVHNSVLDARMYQSSVRRDCAYDWSFDVQSCLGCPATRAPASFQCKALWTYFPQANWQCISQVTNMILNNGGAITLPDVHVRLFEPSCSIRAPWPARDGIPHPCDANRIDKQCGAQSQT